MNKFVVGNTYRMRQGLLTNAPGTPAPAYRMEWLDESKKSRGVALWRNETPNTYTLHLQNISDFEPLAINTPLVQPEPESVLYPAKFPRVQVLAPNGFEHYYRYVHTTHIDVYRVLALFDVTDPCIQHAIKKLLAPGKRGTKDIRKDMSEAIISIQRGLSMLEEDIAANVPTAEASDAATNS